MSDGLLPLIEECHRRDIAIRENHMQLPPAADCFSSSQSDRRCSEFGALLPGSAA